MLVLLATAFFVAVLVGLLSLTLNIPLFLKAYRERTRLKELGLSSLSKSLWKESRRSQWISRTREALLIILGCISLFILVSAWLVLPFIAEKNDFQVFFWMSMAIAPIAALLFGARYLRNQRERMDLTTSVEKLRKALGSLRQRGDDAGVVSVPSELLEQTAKIESAQIAKERQEAVLESVAVRPSGYAITFDRDAAQQRGTLDILDRVELEDLVGQLSTDGAQHDSQAGTVASDAEAGATLQGTTKSKRVEIEYLVDQASHTIRIVAVRREGDGSHTFRNGASHA